jgi:hypothetical protein
MSGAKDVQIKDGFAAGVTDTLAFPDVGLTQKLWVDLNVSNSDVSKVVVELYGPGMSTPYLLYNGGKTGSAVVAKYNDGDALVSGDMNKDWLGKNIKGNWSITVKDTAAITVPPGTPAFVYDGKFNWSISIQTLSSKKIQVKGNLLVDGSVKVGTDNAACDSTKVGALRYTAGATIEVCDGVAWQSVRYPGAVFRWAVFDNYAQANNWYLDNDATLFGGVNPSNWADGNYRPVHLSADKEVLRTLFTQRMVGGKNALVFAQRHQIYWSSTDGRVVMALFRIKNSTGAAINWTLTMRYSAYPSWNEYAGIAVNGVEVWNPGSNAWWTKDSVTMSIPANRTSTVIVKATSGPPWNNYGAMGERQTILGFVDNSLALPAGLQMVDDLDSATGGWEK